MEKLKPTVLPVLDTRRPNSDGTFMVKIQVTWQRQPRKYTLKNLIGKELKLLPEDFSKTISRAPKGQYLDFAQIISEGIQKVEEIIENMRFFDWEEFSEKITGKKVSGDVLDIFFQIESYMAELKASERFGYAESFQCALSALKSYSGRKSLRFELITPAWLNKFEKWFLEKGRSRTTLGIYLRNLRVIFNKAKVEKLISPEVYPFGARQYQIPNSKNVKKALSRENLRSILQYKSETEIESKYFDLWKFSYLANGINMADLCRIKWQDVSNEVIVFTRKKTERSRRDQIAITIQLIPEIQEIINRWGTTPPVPNEYIFDFLNSAMPAEKQRVTVHQVTKMVNKYAGIVAKKLGIEDKITTYTARHTFATMLLTSGTPIGYISESLGHTSILTTQSYLGSFEEKQRVEFARRLVDF